MWFLFGFVTLGVACVSSFLWRRMATWHGKQDRADDLSYEYKIASRRRIAKGANVGVACADGFTFSLRYESRFDIWSKRIGLSRECQTGDAEFDGDFYILSDDPVLHRLLQTDPDLRAGFQRLFKDCANGLGKPKAVYVHGGRIWIDAMPRARGTAIAAEDCKYVVPALHAVAARLTRDGIGLHDDRDPFPFRAACILAVSTGLSINAAIEIFHMWGGDFPMLGDAMAPLPVALVTGIAAVLVMAAVALQVMGRSARTHLVILELLLSGTFGATVTAYGELRDYNFDYDTGPARMVPVVVFDRYTTHSKSGTHYHIHLAGWPPGSAVEVSVSHDFYDEIAVGERFAIEEHPGALGWFWGAAFVPQ